VSSVSDEVHYILKRYEALCSRPPTPPWCLSEGEGWGGGCGAIGSPEKQGIGKVRECGKPGGISGDLIYFQFRQGSSCG